MADFLSNTSSGLQRTLTDLTRRMQEQEAQARARALNVPYIDLHNFPVDLNVLGMIPEAEAREAQAVVFYRDEHDLRIGAVDPKHPVLLERVRQLSGRYQVTVYVISKFDFEQVARFYSKVLQPKSPHDEVVRVDQPADYPSLFKRYQDPAEQQKLTASQLLDFIFGGSMYYGSSDIHLEPEEGFLKLRYRIDGVLQDMLHLSKDLHRPIATRIKIISKLKLNVENVPQDGRITFYYLGKPIDVRVSSLPSAYGEEFVMRLLGTGAVDLKLDALGFGPEHAAIVKRALARPNGMIVTTGPTGSGKTTTLYAFLNQLNEPGVKIITLEDPVEYKLAGIVQTPIDHTVDFSFAKGLRAILRQDPDIVMVGEIRDQETAETAMQAALTGHIVLSTLHTNDAAGAIPRLINMGVKPFVIAPALNLVMAQRLVRRLCPDCKKPVALAPDVMEKVQAALLNLPQEFKSSVPKNPQFFHSVGCDRCHHLGYRGRVGIYELLEVTEAVQKLIMAEAPMSEFRKVGIGQGMVTMVQDGLLKALQGLTDVEEVFRVAGEE